MSEVSKRSSEQILRDALVALWTDRRSDKHAELYAEAMAALSCSEGCDTNPITDWGFENSTTKEDHSLPEDYWETAQ